MIIILLINIIILLLLLIFALVMLGSLLKAQMLPAGGVEQVASVNPPTQVHVAVPVFPASEHVPKFKQGLMPTAHAEKR